jgi:hypothetical protein
MFLILLSFDNAVLAVCIKDWLIGGKESNENEINDLMKMKTATL